MMGTPFASFLRMAASSSGLWRAPGSVSVGYLFLSKEASLPKEECGDGMLGTSWAGVGLTEPNSLLLSFWLLLLLSMLKSIVVFGKNY